MRFYVLRRALAIFIFFLFNNIMTNLRIYYYLAYNNNLDSMLSHLRLLFRNKKYKCKIFSHEQYF